MLMLSPLLGSWPALPTLFYLLTSNVRLHQTLSCSRGQGGKCSGTTDGVGSVLVLWTVWVCSWYRGQGGKCPLGTVEEAGRMFLALSSLTPQPSP